MLNLVFAEPFVLQKYPPDYNDEVSFLGMPSFCHSNFSWLTKFSLQEKMPKLLYNVTTGVFSGHCKPFSDFVIVM